MLVATGLLVLVLVCVADAQPTELINEQARVRGLEPLTDKEIASRAAIEKEYLARARANIERFRKGDAALVLTDAGGAPLANLQVEVDQVTQDFLFGNQIWELSSIWPKETANLDLLRERFKALCNLAIVPFYWSAYERKAGFEEWQTNQAMIQWLRENGFTLKGHPLAWTSPAGTPQWLLALDPELATDLLRARISRAVIGFKGTIDIWDVVNEPVTTIPWEAALKDPANSEKVRYNTRGVEVSQVAPWVEGCYKWANQANPDGNYILNEFFTLAVPDVRDRFYRLLKELQARNTPVKGIGIQAHEPREMWFSPVEIYKTFDMYQEFGVPIHITELIPQSSGKEITGWRRGQWTEAAQAEFAEQFYTLVFGHPSAASITWWGLSDRNIWLPGGGLLDKDYNPKPVYHTLLKLIKTDWMTRNLKLQTDAQGRVSFRGFHGEYSIIITMPDGTKHTARQHLKQNDANQWKIAL
jgi:GH35 family endo-1,4-beta-xylanase